MTKSIDRERAQDAIESRAKAPESESELAKAVRRITENGDDVEIRDCKDGIKVYSVRRKLVSFIKK